MAIATLEQLYITNFLTEITLRFLTRENPYMTLTLNLSKILKNLKQA